MSQLTDEKRAVQEELLRVRQKLGDIESANQILSMEKDKLSEELIAFNSKYTELRIKHDKSEQDRLESQRLAAQYEQRLAKLEPQVTYFSDHLTTNIYYSHVF